MNIERNESGKKGKERERTETSGKEWEIISRGFFRRQKIPENTY